MRETEHPGRSGLCAECGRATAKDAATRPKGHAFVVRRRVGLDSVPMTPEDRTPAIRDEPSRSGERLDREARLRERESRRSERPQGMVPGRARRRTGIERGVMRAIATGGIVGIGVVLGAVLVSQDVAGWIVGLVVSVVSILLSALLWSSRQL
jgi:hypothetical protein